MQRYYTYTTICYICNLFYALNISVENKIVWSSKLTVYRWLLYLVLDIVEQSLM